MYAEDRPHSTVRSLLAFLVVSTLLPTPIRANPADAVKVELGKPSLWTLEQAHYQLARMREKNDGLTSRFPQPEDLDPSAIHGRRLDLLQTLISANVGLDEVAGAQNQMAVASVQADAARRSQLREQLDLARKNIFTLVAEISSLQTELQQRQAAGANEEETKPLIDAIAAKGVLRTTLESQITSLSTEAGNLSTTPANLAQPFSTNTSSTAPQSVVKEIMEKLFDGTSDQPKLHASRVLDNHVQMQYEIVAKQLTLLRDELGPDQRLIFLELPQWIYTRESASRGYLARTEWRLARYYKAGAEVERDFYENRRLPKASELCRGENAVDLTRCEEDRAECPDVRIIDLIPRESALNINTIQGKTKGLSLGAKISKLIGFAASVGLERRRDMLDQIVRQDMFASAFGKGSRTFGWIFGPEPGNTTKRRIKPGLKTTYAVAVVPRDAVGIELESAYCAFHRKKPLPNVFLTQAGSKTYCQKAQSFTIPIPPAGQGFWLDRVQFAAVDRGNRATVFLRGEGFSPQIGVLINGTPLNRVPSVARHTQAAPLPPADHVDGVFEIVNGGDLVLAFSMGSAFVGTPVIALVTPGKVAPINYWDSVYINNMTGITLADYSDDHPMFREKIDILALDVIPPKSRGNPYLVLVEGKGFRKSTRVAINGAEVCGPSRKLPPCEVSSTSQILLPPGSLFSADWSSDADWIVEVAYNSSAARQEARRFFPNPLLPVVERYEILRHVPCERDAKGNVVSTERLDVVLHGHNLDRAVIPHAVSGGKATVLSGEVESLTPESLYVPIQNPDNPTLLRLDRQGIQLAAMTTVYPPQAPRIYSMMREGTMNAEGPTRGGYLVVIRGENLAQVRRVFFGSAPATDVLPGGDTVLTVRAPGGDGPVQVLLETDVFFKGRPLTNGRDLEDPTRAVFAFKDPPKKSEQNGGGS